jgi:hypothetical protein
MSYRDPDWRPKRGNREHISPFRKLLRNGFTICSCMSAPVLGLEQIQKTRLHRSFILETEILREAVVIRSSCRGGATS